MLEWNLFAHHIAVQSKCTISHFDGLNAIESALWMPFNHTRYSGQMNAEPAYAASTCSQTLCFTQTDPIWKVVTISISNLVRTRFHEPIPTSSKLSNAQAPVVPSVAQTCRKMDKKQIVNSGIFGQGKRREFKWLRHPSNLSNNRVATGTGSGSRHFRKYF